MFAISLRGTILHRLTLISTRHVGYSYSKETPRFINLCFLTILFIVTDTTPTKYLLNRVTNEKCGVMVSTLAFESDDPSSVPEKRSLLLLFLFFYYCFNGFCVCFFELRLYVTVNNFSVISRRFQNKCIMYI